MQTKNFTDRIGTEKISKLLIDFSIPAIIGMIVNAVYNIVDRIYIGQGGSSLGIAGIALVMPLILIIMAASMLIGIGANSLFSIRLGEGRRDEVEKIMGHGLVLLFLIPGIVIVVMLVFIDPILLHILQASDAIFPLAKQYLLIILFGGVFSAVGPGLNHFIRSDGHPRTSMFTQILGAVINIILDPIFIFGFGWGIAGAAWATVISQFISFVWVMCYFNSRWTKLRFRLRNMKLDLRLSLLIMAIGFAPFAMQFAISFVNILLNRELNRWGGDVAVTSMGVVYSILILFFMPIMGLNQGAQPIIGYNYGAKKFDRVKSAYKLAVISGTVFCILGFILLHVIPRIFIGAFRIPEGELMITTEYALKTCTLLMPFLAFQMITSNYFQAVGKPVQGTLLSLSRQIIFFIPLLMILPHFFKLHGVFMTMPIADALSVLFSTGVMLVELKKLDKDIITNVNP
jgi:putative MATE family efflux protein